MNPFETLVARHRLFGTASFYSAFFDGRRTANGDMYRNAGFSAAHLTLPMGFLVEVESLATGRRVEVTVNDRGPYSGGFVIDLSQAAAEAIGVVRAPDRRVRIRLLAAGLTGPQNGKISKGGRRTSRSSEGEGHAEPATLPER